MRLPDPNAPVPGLKFLIYGGIGCLIFTLIMAVGTYGVAVGWAHFHGAPQVRVPK